MDVRLTVLPEHACPYLPDRAARLRAFAVGRLSPDLYHDFMDAGFRRSGRMIYQPVCTACRQCIPVRVRVPEFLPSKSQRRCARRNADLIISSGTPQPTPEKFELYRRYVSQWHQNRTAAGNEREAEPTHASFESFLYESPVSTLEFEYRHPTDHRLIAVGLCDVSRQSLSSVYFYFDPTDAARGLGTFGALHEITWARQAEIPFYYLGFWVSGCGAMEYKNKFAPYEFLNGNGNWEPNDNSNMPGAF